MVEGVLNGNSYACCLNSPLLRPLQWAARDATDKTFGHIRGNLTEVDRCFADCLSSRPISQPQAVRPISKFSLLLPIAAARNGV